MVKANTFTSKPQSHYKADNNQTRWSQNSQHARSHFFECTLINIFTAKLNRKQQLLWSCFAFIMRNMGQDMATKSLHCQLKTAILFESRPVIHCMASWVLKKCTMYIMYANGLCLSFYLILVVNNYFKLVTNIFGIGVMMLLTLYSTGQK